jgi:succinate dehydrogenase / fumarate reductase cytochrome b subunit
LSDKASWFDRNYFLLRRLHSLSGVVPIGVFLLFHLTTNASIVWGLMDGRKAVYGHAGVAAYQSEVGFISRAPFLLLTEIFVLWIPIAFHSLLGLYYARTGKHNAYRYSYQDNWRYSLQRWSGYVGLLFIFWHVATLRWGWTFLLPGGTKWDHQFAASTMAAILQGRELATAADGTTWMLTGAGIAVSLAYLIGVSLLVFHFANGLWTAAITWGVTISQAAQRRFGRVCVAVGVLLMLAGWSSVIGFMTLDQKVARETEVRVLREAPELMDKKEAGDALLGTVAP